MTDLNNYKKQFISNRSRNQPSLIQNGIATTDAFNSVNVKQLLGFIHTSQDIDLQIKLFSKLAACLVNNESHRESIILDNQIYLKIHNLLLMNLSRKASILFNFLTILISTENEDSFKAKSLIIRAKNMIRISGCLVFMANMFANGMVFHETWFALCRCLAETCRDLEVNQNFCSHLVPVCITKCSHGSTEVFPLLESLLQKHERNIRLFVECHGFSLITRENLLNNNSMQLLNILVRNSTSAKFIVHNSNIVNDLREILDICGADSLAGQWAVIVLHHASPYLTDTEEKEDVTQRLKRFLFKKSNTSILNSNSSVVESLIVPDEMDNTGTVFGNLFHEICQFGPKNLFSQEELQQLTHVISRLTKQTQNPSQDINKDETFVDNNKKKTTEITANNHSTRRLGEEKQLSFSFLDVPKTTIKVQRKIKGQSNCAKPGTYYKNKDITETHEQNISNYSTRACNTRIYSQLHDHVEDSMVNMENFQPIYSSTPNNSNVAKKLTKQLHKSTIIYNSRKNARRQLSSSIKKKPIKKWTEKKQQSISSRLFSAINDSCANIFNSVKNIFISKESNCDGTNSKGDVNSDCSYSFTNYMRKREEYFRRKSNADNKFELGAGSKDLNSYRNDTCRTCNDTISLKDKLKNDEHLKQTVKKLKIGVNLYGCDFKKISKALWPKEAYMTPNVLHNLYRKLIIK